MGVGLGYPSVRGPAGVSDTNGGVVRRRQHRLKVANFSNRPKKFNRAVVLQPKACGVVAPILQTTQTFNQQRHGALMSNVTKDTAHVHSSEVNGGAAHRAR